MSDLTSNFRLGFGGYVDKPLSPYTTMFKPVINSTLEGMAAKGINILVIFVIWMTTDVFYLHSLNHFIDFYIDLV